MDKQKLEELYLDKRLSCKQIGSQLDIHAVTVLKALKRYKIPTRGKNGKEKIVNNLRHNFFKHIQSNVAYWLGYIVADGCIRPTKYTVSFKSIDYELLDKLKRSLQSNSAVKLVNDHYEFEIYSKTIVNDLFDLGIGPRKTFVVGMPSAVSDKHFWDFLRGLIDGDGHIYVNRIGFSLAGNATILNQVKNKIKQLTDIENIIRPQGKIWTLSYYGENAFHLLKKIYPSQVGLSRKRNLAQSMMDAYVAPQFCSVCDNSIGLRKQKRSIQYCNECKRNRCREANRKSYNKRVGKIT